MIESAPNPDIFLKRLHDLCVRHHGHVLNACRRYVQNPDDAEDLAQEVLLKAARAWPGFAGRCAGTTWLYRVARNHCASHHRALRRRDALLRLHEAELPLPAPLPVPGDMESDPVEELARLWERLRERLGEDERLLAHLRFERGLQLDCIARVTGKPRPTVNRQLLAIRRRASRLWRELLDDPGADGGPPGR